MFVVQPNGYTNVLFCLKIFIEQFLFFIFFSYIFYVFLYSFHIMVHDYRFMYEVSFT